MVCTVAVWPLVYDPAEKPAKLIDVRVVRPMLVTTAFRAEDEVLDARTAYPATPAYERLIELDPAVPNVDATPGSQLIVDVAPVPLTTPLSMPGPPVRAYAK